MGIPLCRSSGEVMRICFRATMVEEDDDDDDNDDDAAGFWVRVRAR